MRRAQLKATLMNFKAKPIFKSIIEATLILFSFSSFLSKTGQHSQLFTFSSSSHSLSWTSLNSWSRRRSNLSTMTSHSGSHISTPQVPPPPHQIAPPCLLLEVECSYVGGTDSSWPSTESSASSTLWLSWTPWTHSLAAWRPASLHGSSWLTPNSSSSALISLYLSETPCRGRRLCLKWPTGWWTPATYFASSWKQWWVPPKWRPCIIPTRQRCRRWWTESRTSRITHSSLKCSSYKWQCCDLFSVIMKTLYYIYYIIYYILRTLTNAGFVNGTVSCVNIRLHFVSICFVSEERDDYMTIKLLSKAARVTVCFAFLTSTLYICSSDQ